MIASADLLRGEAANYYTGNLQELMQPSMTPEEV